MRATAAMRCVALTRKVRSPLCTRAVTRRPARRVTMVQADLSTADSDAAALEAELDKELGELS